MATNEYGFPLDSNGYAPSVMQGDMELCYICKMGGDLARHEPLNGSRREKSKRLGLWVTICPACHASAHGAGVVANANRMQMKQDAQRAAMQRYGWSVDDFIREFGRNYL